MKAASRARWCRAGGVAAFALLAGISTSRAETLTCHDANHFMGLSKLDAMPVAMLATVVRTEFETLDAKREQAGHEKVAALWTQDGMTAEIFTVLAGCRDHDGDSLPARADAVYADRAARMQVQ